MIRAAVLAVASVALFAGCGERPQVLSYKHGTYQGKPDTPAYSNAPFNGDKAAWEKALAQRNQSQNEYKRIK
jgi:hypothetical protein